MNKDRIAALAQLLEQEPNDKSNAPLPLIVS
jgi:hypothetical protein